MFWTSVFVIILVTFLRDSRNVYWVLGLNAYILWGYARYICWAIYVMLFKDIRLVLDWDEFWHRYLYGNVRECWNRPVLSGPGIKISIAERIKSHALLPMEETGRSIECTNMGSYNYLGTGGRYFGTEKEEKEERWTLHSRLEETIKKFLGKEYCIVVPTGYATNSSIIPCIADLTDGPVLILSDSLNHTSIVRGIQSCEEQHNVKIFKHNDIEDLRRKYHIAHAHGTWPVVLVIVEGLYSMEGDYPPLKELVKFRNEFKNVQLYVDEAHSIGALGETGRGICERMGVLHDDIDFLMGTFTKSFASIGGYVTFNDPELGRRARKLYYERFRHTITPLHTQCSSQILGVMKWLKETNHESIKKLRQNSIYLRRKLKKVGCEVLGEHDSPVIPIMLRDVATIEPINRIFLEKGFAVVSVGYPATPLLEGGRLRFCVSANHEKNQLRKLVQVMDRSMDELRMLRLRISPESLLEAKEEYPVKPVPKSRFRDGRRFWPMEEDDGRPLPVPNEMKPLELNGTRQAIDKYGCGSCGPRGFYGTTDVHLALEESLALFYGREAVALYAHGQCVASSVIPNLVNQMGGPNKVAIETRPKDWEPRYDVMLAIKLSRAPHNIEGYQSRKLLVITPDFEAKTEIFKAMCKDDLSLVWVVDEFERPFGDTRKQKLPDLILGSLEGDKVGSMGGFCVGKRVLVETQRLYAKSYVFSASPPPFLCEVANKKIKKMEN